MLPILVRCGCIVRVEGAQSAPPPACHEVGRLCFLAFILFRLPLQLAGEFEESAEQGGAVVSNQLDEPGLLHEAAELDELPGACAPVLDPLAGVVAGTGAIEPIAQHGQALELCRCCLELP